jgi:hypothetical protein
MAQYIHHVPGRLRIKSSRLKHNSEESAAVRELMSPIRGIADIQVNSVTGSVLIGYDKEAIKADVIIELLKQHGYCGHAAELPIARGGAADTLTQALARAGQTLGKVAVGVMIEKLAERSAVALIGALI